MPLDYGLGAGAMQNIGVLLGAVAAAWWSIYVISADWLLQWQIVCLLATAALWAMAIVPSWVVARTQRRVFVALALVGGVLLAVFPVAVNAWALLRFGWSGSLDAADILYQLGVLAALVLPLAAGLICLRVLYRQPR